MYKQGYQNKFSAPRSLVWPQVPSLVMDSGYCMWGVSHVFPSLVPFPCPKIYRQVDRLYNTLPVGVKWGVKNKWMNEWMVGNIATSKLQGSACVEFLMFFLCRFGFPQSCLLVFSATVMMYSQHDVRCTVLLLMCIRIRKVLKRIFFPQKAPKTFIKSVHARALLQKATVQLMLRRLPHFSSSKSYNHIFKYTAHNVIPGTKSEN